MKHSSSNPDIDREDNYDLTKRMLDTARKGFVLKEEQYETANNAPDTSASQSEDLPPDLFNAEKKSFMDTVSAKVDFRGFKIYRKERNVIFSGKMQDMSGLEWVMRLRSDDGLTITVENLKIDNDTITVLNKLNGFYTNWSKAWATKINTSYQYQA